ncbi:MAG: nitroreductase family protein [Myxococcota bacterium]|nr:nitroreductase family protein [Myxococcota bacterium]
MSGFIPYRPRRLAQDTGLERLKDLHAELDARRSVRHFSPEPVARPLIEQAIMAASTAPSGAHRQPWRFVAISQPDLKHRIRVAAEAEEKRSYDSRMPAAWKDALAPLGTTWQKPYLETVPWIVVVFAENYRLMPDGSKRKNYYVRESVGIACGLFIAALQRAGLATLTHTPSPMRFLSEILERPPGEQAMILFPIGYPAPDATVPDITRKTLSEVAIWHEDSGSSL